MLLTQAGIPALAGQETTGPLEWCRVMSHLVWPFMMCAGDEHVTNPWGTGSSIQVCSACAVCGASAHAV